MAKTHLPLSQKLPRGWYEQPAVLEVHLPVLEEVVEDGEDVPLRLLDPLQHQHATLRRCLHRALKYQEDEVKS